MAARSWSTSLQALLQEVGAPVRSSVEEPQGVLRLGVLAQHDHADVRVEVAQRVGGLQPLVGSARRHADVRHDDVGPLALDGGQECIEIAARRDDLDVGLEVEQPPHSSRTSRLSSAMTVRIAMLATIRPSRMRQPLNTGVPYRSTTRS